jgi:hypothetical protein
MKVAARAPRDITRDTATASGSFERGWWAGVRGFQPTAAAAAYQAGYASGLAWRAFHGPGRRPHETHAADARERQREIPDAAEALRLHQESTVNAPANKTADPDFGRMGFDQADDQSPLRVWELCQG